MTTNPQPRTTADELTPTRCDDESVVIETVGEGVTPTRSPPPSREPSCQLRRPPVRFGEEATVEEIENAVGDSNEQAFTAINGEPRTYKEAMHTAQAKEWEEVVSTELEQL